MFTTRPELLGTHGMVASTHWLASSAGMAMLERGGTAADAAVAAGFVLQVVEPHLNGPGGDAPILVARGDDELPTVICGQGPVPAAATPERIAALGLDAIPGSGLIAACVPGAVDAWLLLLRDWGRLRLRDVLAPAIDYAEHGHPVLGRVSTTIAAVAAHLVEHWPTSAAIYLSDGAPPAPGSLLRNPTLAATLRRLVAEGEATGGKREAHIEGARDAFLRRFVAEAIDGFCTTQELLDGGGERRGGLLRADDMAAWNATLEPPVHIDHAGFVVCKPGPWSQGPVFLQQLRLLDACGIADIEPGSAEWVHTIVECAKLAFADREAWYGDPVATRVPLDALLSVDYARERSRLVGAHASLELRPGAPAGREPRLPRTVAGVTTRQVLDATAGEPTLGVRGEARGDTCHIDVVDSSGMMVTATPSGGWLQSSPVIPELGFCLGTRAQMTWLEPGLPSSLRPRTRPRTTLSATMAMRDGRPALAIGTPGGDQQDQWSLNVFAAHVHGGLGLQEAIDAATFHSTHFPSSFAPRHASPGELVVEERLGVEVITELRRRGHRVVVNDPWSLGRVSAVARGRDGVLRAAANPRGMQGYAVGR